MQEANARAKAINLAKNRAKRVLKRTIVLEDPDNAGDPELDVIFDCSCGLKGRNLMEDDVCATCSRCHVRFHLSCANYENIDEDDIPEDILVRFRSANMVLIYLLSLY